MGSGPGRRSLLAFGLGATLCARCNRSGGSRAEPGAARWKPILNDRPPPSPPPPTPDSEPERIERAEILERNRRRDPGAVARARWWNLGAVVRWNEVARELVARRRTDACLASRAYALLSVAQYDALIAVWQDKNAHQRPPLASRVPNLEPLFPEGPHPKYPSLHAAVAAASSAVLASLYPEDASTLNAQAADHMDSRLVAGAALRSDLEAGKQLGYGVAAQVARHAAGDGADRAEAAPIPSMPSGAGGLWTSDSLQKPLQPGWGAVRPWLVKSLAAVRAPPPPRLDHPQFRAALDELRRIARSRTPEQRRVAALWADGDGSYTPPGRWNKTAADLILEHGLTELRAARLMAFMNMAVMDAGIACWDAKYRYQLVRPSLVAPEIDCPVGLPNHPAYPSAHAAFSGAAAGLLAWLFPRKATHLLAAAAEAALSRVYGGIHYRFDGDAGLVQGRAVAALAIERARQDEAVPG